MAAIQYKISFVPESNYGCITKRTTSRKEAYAIYRELKAQIGEIRPGYLSVFEILDDGTERYLCRYQTGKNRNGKLLTKELQKQVKHLCKIYNQEYLNSKMSEYSKIQSNLIHGIELMDMTKVDPYVFSKHVIEKQEMIAHLRRQYKSDLYDAKTLENDLKELAKLINKIFSSINDLKQYRLVADVNKPNQAQMSYLESLGIDVGAYCHNANPEEVLPLGQLIKDLKDEEASE
jgi:hypothetical protein